MKVWSLLNALSVTRARDARLLPGCDYRQPEAEIYNNNVDVEYDTMPGAAYWLKLF